MFPSFLIICSQFSLSPHQVTETTRKWMHGRNFLSDARYIQSTWSAWLGILVLPVPRPGGKSVVPFSHFCSGILSLLKKNHISVLVVCVSYLWSQPQWGPWSWSSVVLFPDWLPTTILTVPGQKNESTFFKLLTSYSKLALSPCFLEEQASNINVVTLPLSLHFCNFACLLPLLSYLKEEEPFLSKADLSTCILVIFSAYILLALTDPHRWFPILTPPALWRLHYLFIQHVCIECLLFPQALRCGILYEWYNGELNRNSPSNYRTYKSNEWK